MDRGQARVEELEARVARLERLVADEAARIRAELAELGWEPAPEPPRRRPLPYPPPQTPTAKPIEPYESPDLSWLAGPRGLAIAGGIVTLLGIVFIFALAVSRGWIGPAARCAIGGLVSVMLVGAGVVVRRRYENFVAGLAAAGTGIGGAYVTLYAASRGYHLIGNATVWVAVLVTAAAAMTLALAWDSELLACLGLLAIVAAPPAVEGRTTAVGLGVSAVAAAAALGVGSRRNWIPLGGLAYFGVLLQTGIYVIDASDSDHRSTAGILATIVFALALAGAAAYRRTTDGDAFPSALAAISLPIAIATTFLLVDGDTGRGFALLAAAGAYALYSAALLAFERMRTLVEVSGASALVLVALATAEFLSNGGLALAWTLEGLAATLVATRLRESRYQAAAIAYFALAAGHLLIYETPPSHLFSQRTNPAQHVGWLLILVIALAAAALLLRGEELVVERLDLSLAVAAALLLLYAASLAVLEASQHLGGADLHAKFQRGETFVSALWALVALGLLAVGLARRIPEVRYSGLGLLGLALVKIFFFDLSQLSSLTRAASFLAVGLTLLAGGFVVQRLAADD